MGNNFDLTVAIMEKNTFSGEIWSDIFFCFQNAVFCRSKNIKLYSNGQLACLGGPVSSDLERVDPAGEGDRDLLARRPPKFPLCRNQTDYLSLLLWWTQILSVVSYYSASNTIHYTVLKK